MKPIQVLGILLVISLAANLYLAFFSPQGNQADLAEFFEPGEYARIRECPPLHAGGQG